MRTAIILFLLSGVLACSSYAQKTAVHWYLPTMSLEEAGGLKGYDLVMIDPEAVFNSRESLDALRAANPQIKIYCYFNVVEWFNPMWDDKPWSRNIMNFMNRREAWFLHGKDGQRLSFWEDERTGRKMQTLNCRIDCPKSTVYDGGRPLSYLEFITERFIEDILKTYHFDGVLMDNLWNKIHWLGKYGANKNGFDYGSALADNDSIGVNLLWKQGMDYCLNELAKFGGPGFLVGNPGHLSYPQCAGKMFENFPEIYLNEADTVYQAWFENLNNAATFPAGPCIFNARKDNYFFTLASAMLLDHVYFSYLQNTRYEDKYRLNLGQALAPAQINGGVASRAYEQGTVCVDPLFKKAWIIYNDGRERKE